MNDKTNFGCFRKMAHPKNAEEGQGYEEARISDTLNVFDNTETRTPTLIIENHPQDSRVKLTDTFQTLSGRMGTGGGNVPMVMKKEQRAVVRRLTPLECERLQGFPDGWTNIGTWTDTQGKKHKLTDAPRYQALGNSIAVGYANNKSGFWCWLAERMVEQLRKDGVEDPTMASLFDGIGGFPLAFSAYGCRPIWASEIEEFPIAVTKKQFPEREERKEEDGRRENDSQREVDEDPGGDESTEGK